MMKFVTKSVLLILIASGCLFGQSTQNLWVTAYYQDYGVCAMPPAQVDYSAMTHIIYFHTDVDVNVAPYFLPVVSAAESVRVEWSNSNQGCARTSGESYQVELIRRSHAAGVKVLLCVGGIWGAGADRMALIAADSVKTQIWANSLVAYLVRKGFDGIDLDWEFPRVQSEYMRMLRILRRGLDSMPARGIFAAAVYGDANSSAYDYPKLSLYLDQVNCMTYDMWNNQNTVWLNSPLGKAAGSPSNWRTWRGSSALSWAAKGVPKSILANGIPFYTWKFSNVTALGQPLSGYSYGIYTDAVNALANGGTYHWDDSAKAPYVTYASGGVNYLITYDDTNSVKYKVQRSKDDGIGGIMIYGLWDGWLSGAPTGKKDGLLQAVKSALGGGFVPPPTTAAPTLGLPLDGASDLGLATALSWSVAAGVTSSRLQVATNSAFTALVVDQGPIAGTTYLASGLSNGTTYYWRASATGSNGTSAWSAARSFTTIAGPPTAPQAPVLLSPAQGALDIVTNPNLRWRRPSGATEYRLQLSTSSDFSVLLADQSGIADTTFHIDSLGNSAVHYWRVLASNTIGASPWSSTWNFTTEAFVAASSTLPVFQDTVGSVWRDNSWNATVNYNSTERVYEGAKAIRVDQNAWGGLSMHSGPWGASVNIDPQDYAKLEFAVNGGASGARISVVLDNDQAEPFPVVSYGTVPANEWAVVSIPMSQINPANHIIHRVGILEMAGAARTYFVDNIRFVGSGAPAELQAPSLLSPAQSAGAQDTALQLRWSASSGAASYRLQVSTSAAFGATLADHSGLADTAFALGGLGSGTTYFWRVSASDSAATSPWSSVRNFATVAPPAPPAAPALLAPAQDAVGVPVATTLRWNRASGATSYALELSASSDFSSTIVAQAGIAETTYATSGLVNSAAHYWRVSATGTYGTSPWSPARNFTTVAALPAPPLLAFPAQSDTGVAASMAVRWNAVAGASSYTLQVSISSSFSSTVVAQAGITDTSYAVSGLGSSTLYYWRVNASNLAGAGAWSSTRDFTTESPSLQPPIAPPLRFPGTGATNIPTATSLRWNTVAGALSYRVQVSTSSLFSSFFLDQSDVAETTLAVSGLSNSATYYWRVNATNAAGTSAWSSTRSLSTQAASPSFAANPTNLNFGRVGIGQWKKDSLTVTNQGNTSLSITQMESTLPQYSVNSSAGTIAPGNSAKVFVTFAPSQRITYDARIAIVINSGNSSDTVVVTGKGVNPARLRHGTAFVNLGNVAPEDMKSDTVMMYNDGELELDIAGIQSTNAVFSITPLQAVIAPADSLPFVITAQPTVTGVQDGYFFFDYNGIDTPDTLHVRIDNALAIGDPSGDTPEAFVLRQNYPNPFNPSTTISFDLPSPAVVSLKIYNSLGEEVATIYSGQQMSAGSQEVVFQADRLPSGIYYYGLTARSADLDGIVRQDARIAQMKKMILVK